VEVEGDAFLHADEILIHDEDPIYAFGNEGLFRDFGGGNYLGIVITYYVLWGY